MIQIHSIRCYPNCSFFFFRTRFSIVKYFNYHFTIFQKMNFLDFIFSRFLFIDPLFRKSNIPLFNSFYLSIWIWTFGETTCQIDWPENSKDSTHNWILDILRIQWGTSIAPFEILEKLMTLGRKNRKLVWISKSMRFLFFGW